MTRMQRAAERAAEAEAALRRDRDALRARMEVLRPMLEVRNEEMSAGGHGADPMHGDVLLAPGEGNPDTALPRAIEVRTPAGLAFRLGIAEHNAVLKLEWLMTAESRPLPYRLFDRIEPTPNGDAVLSLGGGRALGFKYLLDAVEARVLG